jgi:hypothetical protein
MDNSVRLEYDEGQLHTTFHDRNDGVMVADVACGDDEHTAAAEEVAREVCRRFNEHNALVDSLRDLVSTLEELNEGNDGAVELPELKAARKLLKRLYP